MIRHALLLTAFFCFRPLDAGAQVLMPVFEHGASSGVGGATVAADHLRYGLGNEARLGLGAGAGALAGTALPYGLQGWQSFGFNGWIQAGRAAGLGVEVYHAGLEYYTEQRFQLSYGRRLGEKVLLGGSFQYLRISADEYGSAGAPGFGIGMLAEPIPNLWLGARIQNPVRIEITGADVPRLLQIGAQWRLSDIFSILGQVDKDLERDAQIKLGLEYRPVQPLYLRLGMRSDPSRLSLGAGFRLKNGIALDAGSEWHPFLGITPAFALSWMGKR